MNNKISSPHSNERSRNDIAKHKQDNISIYSRFLENPFQLHRCTTALEGSPFETTRHPYEKGKKLLPPFW
jgi:hypothetical protein